MATKKENSFLKNHRDDITDPAEALLYTGIPKEPITEPRPEPEEQPVAPKMDLMAGIVKKKPKAKAYTFYLDDEVVAALEKVAKQHKTNKSKALNTMLRNALLK